MNPSVTQQLLGNGCMALAAFLFLVPLQLVLFELRSKAMDGGAVFAVGLLLLSLWTLFVVGLVLVTASGGFDWLRLSRWAQYLLVTAAITGLLVVSSMRFETRMPEPNLLQVVFIKWPIQFVPLLTIALVVLSLNPQWWPNVPRQYVQWAWAFIAACCLVFWVGLLAYRLVTYQSATRAAHTVRAMANGYKSDVVRKAAIAKLRGDPPFITKLADKLRSISVQDGLDVVSIDTFSEGEKKQLALPVRSAMERVTQDTRREFRYIAKDRRKSMRKSVGREFNHIATQFASTGVDYRPAIHAFEATFDDPKTTEDN